MRVMSICAPHALLYYSLPCAQSARIIWQFWRKGQDFSVKVDILLFLFQLLKNSILLVTYHNIENQQYNCIFFYYVLVYVF